MKNWDKLTSINQYLEKNREKGIQAFKQLLKKAKDESAELVVLCFTYENIEAYAKVNGTFELYDEFLEVLSQYELDQLSRYNYTEGNHYQDFEYYKFHNLVWELIEIWMINCFELANKNQATDIKYYFKHHHDSLEILELNSCITKLEKSEFDNYIKNNKEHVINLLS